MDIMFDDPEFYDVGHCATVSVNSGKKVLIMSEGERCLTSSNGEVLRTALDFRKRFPNGKIPDESSDWTWVNNGWFEVYTENQLNNGIEGELTYSMSEAIDIAFAIANEMER
jgi:hypothetical protein